MCRAAQGALTWALGIRVRPGNLWMGLFTLTVPRKQIHGQGCVSVGQDMCEIEGGFSLAVCESGSPAGHRGFADTPREMQLREMIFVLCTHTHSICLQPCPCTNPCGVSHGRPFPHTWDPSAGVPACLDVYKSTFIYCIYCPLSLCLHISPSWGLY